MVENWPASEALLTKVNVTQTFELEPIRSHVMRWTLDTVHT